MIARFHRPVAAMTLVLFASPVVALEEDGADWPHWRGADGTGVSAETGWSTTGADQSLWSKHIGFGHSSFAVADGRLFAMGYDLDDKVDVVYCLDPVTGDELWTHTYPADFWNEGHDGGTCTTPTVDGETVYTSNREGKLFALRADSGSVIWSVDALADHGVTPPRWGFAGSTVVVEDNLIANFGKLTSFDKTTGELQWITEKEYGNAYSTPIDFDWHGRPCLLVFNGLGLAAIDRADGTEIAFHPFTQNPERAIYGATPVIIDGRVFISATSGGGCAMLEPKEDGTFEVGWQSRVLKSDYAGPVLYKGHLYGFDSSILKCIDLDGNEMWRKRGIGLGAMVVVGGKLLIVGAKGELIVAEASPDGYVELSRTKVLDGGACWSTPVLSHGLVYARNSLGDMVCRDHRTTVAAASTETKVPEMLPSGADVLANHVRAIGGADALGALTSIHLTGKGESHGGGPIERTDATLTWAADEGFAWRFSSGLDFGYNSELGWNMSMAGPRILEAEQIAPIREVGDLQGVLQPQWGFETVETTGTQVFDDRLCYVVEASREDGVSRTMYFEVETGLLAGREGDDVPLWTFNDYRQVGGVTLPMEWSYFAPGSGAMTLARFESASLNDADDASLDPPVLIRMMTRSPEEKEAINAQLREKYSHLVGSYQLATGSMAGTPITISIDEGAIRMALGPQPPDYLTEPDDEGRLYVMSNRQLYIERQPTEDDSVVFLLFAYGDEFGRVERTEGD